MREHLTGIRHSSPVGPLTAKRASRSGLLWGLIFAFLIANEALTYDTTFPTAASRQQFAATFGRNDALSAIVGPGHQLDTVNGVVAWRVFGLMIIVGAIWGLLTATRLMRGEEDSGRWELLLCGQTSRRRAAGQALVGLAAGWLVLWTITAAVTVAAGLSNRVGFTVTASLYYATAATASSALFLGVGAFTSQLASTRRGANGLAAAVFGVCYLVRLIADAGVGLGWLRWASPLGWVESMRPLTDSQPWTLLPIAALGGGLALAAVTVAGHRDVGSGALARAPLPGEAPVRGVRMTSPIRLAWYLERWTVVAWIVGLGVLALVFGIVATTAADANFASNVNDTVGRLGGSGGGALAWIGYLYLWLSVILACAAAAQIAALHSEESAGHLDNLIARSVARKAWLAGRLGVALILVLGGATAAAIGGWVGVSGEGVGLVPMVKAALNTAIPGLLALGVGTLLYGLVPRLAAPTVYAGLLWSFLVGVFGTGLTDKDWLINTGLLTHLGPVPAADLRWDAIVTLSLIAVLGSALGLVAFDRRDLTFD